MGDVLEFTGEYYTRVKRSKTLADTLALDLVISMQDQHNLDISDQQFVYGCHLLMQAVNTNPHTVKSTIKR